MHIKAYAKINLGLAVVAKRPDGFHELDTLFARIALQDELEFTPISKGIHLEVEGAELPLDRDNLMYQAAELYFQAAKISAGISIYLKKNIPIAAGLGGGSSDAAAVLRALAKLYPAQLDLQPLAERLGSDVSFFLQDVSLAQGRGRGEFLEPLEPINRHLILINPGIHVSAKEAYLALKGFDKRLELPKLLKALQEHKEPEYINSLEPGVLELYPEIKKVLKALRTKGLQGVLMSGSGSTCFALVQDADEAITISQQLQKEYSHWWIQASFLL